MTVQFSTPVRNAELDTIEATIGTGPLMYFRTGAPPVNAAAGDTGSLLATLTLPSDWMTAASSGSKVKAGTWSVAASGSGTVGHFRVKDSGGTVTHIQGTVTATGGGGDLTLDNVVAAAAQIITVTTFTITAGNP